MCTSLLYSPVTKSHAFMGRLKLLQNWWVVMWVVKSGRGESADVKNNEYSYENCVPRGRVELPTHGFSVLVQPIPRLHITSFTTRYYLASITARHNAPRNIMLVGGSVGW